MARSTEQVLQHHTKLSRKGTSLHHLHDYADDAVLMTKDSANVGTAAIQGFFVTMQKVLPNAKLTLTG